jgi:hypothetical protein
MIRLLLLTEIIVFLAAALMHFGILVKGYEHDKARIAETIIAIILFIGLLIGYIFPARMNKSAIIVQWIALAGTIIGMFTIIIGVGPRSNPDYVFHTIMIFLLIYGLVITKRS